MSKNENRINVYIPNRPEFDAQIKEAVEYLRSKGHVLAQHETREPSASKVLLAALEQIIKESKNRPSST